MLRNFEMTHVAALDERNTLDSKELHDIYFNNDKLNDTAIYETANGFGGTE